MGNEVGPPWLPAAVAGASDIVGGDVASVLGSDWAASYRVFHPAVGEDGLEVTWSDLASHRRGPLTASTTWSEVAGVAPHLSPPPMAAHTSEPRAGYVPHELLGRLLDAVHDGTGSRERVVVLEWRGWGRLDHIRDSLQWWRQPYVAFVKEAREVRNDRALRVSACWPESQEWLFATPLDEMSTYLGTRTNLHDRLSAADIEFLSVSPSTSLA